MSGHPDADLGVYVLGVLPGDESTRLRLHLETCARCRARLGELEGTSELLSAARLAPESPPGLLEAALATLPARRADADGGGVAGGGGGVDGDFVLGHPDETAEASHRRRALVLMAVVAASLTCAAFAWVLTPGTGGGSGEVPLTALDSTSSGTVRALVDNAGTALVIHATGLATGSYTVELDGLAAGSFRSTEATVDVELHTAASSGHLEVTREPDSVTVLVGDLP